MHVRGEWLAVPCQDAKLTVGWLGREAVRRYMKNKPDNGGFASVDEVTFLVRRCKGLGLLDNEDLLEVALEDNEFVEVGEWPSGACPGGGHPRGRECDGKNRLEHFPRGGGRPKLSFILRLPPHPHPRPPIDGETVWT